MKTKLPGIYLKFDIEALRVHVHEERRSLVQFATRLCGIVGGIYATFGMIVKASDAAVGRIFPHDKQQLLPATSPDKTYS